MWSFYRMRVDCESLVLKYSPSTALTVSGTVEGENKWLALIQNAATHPTKVDNDKEGQ
jgi:hypothetical protein